jgi:hypothetical protein
MKHKMIPLTLVEHGQLPEAAHALISGRARAFVVVFPKKDWEFHYVPNGWKKAQSGQYQIRNPKRLATALFKSYDTKQKSFELAPGNLLNAAGEVLTVVLDEIHFNDAGVFVEHRLDEYGNPEEVVFPMECFSIQHLDESEYVDNKQQEYGAATKLTTIVRHFLLDRPKGYTRDFEEWIHYQPQLSVVERGNGKSVQLKYGPKLQATKYWNWDSVARRISEEKKRMID